MHKLQKLVFPKSEITAPIEMYFRSSETVSTDVEGVIGIPLGQTVSLDTFFNGFSVAPWKENCRIDNLGIALVGKGNVTVRIGLHSIENGMPWLGETTVDLSAVPVEIDLPFWSMMSDGILFYSVTANTDSEISDGYYFTKDAPTTDVKLGIVITHFNRKHYVLPAMKRISDTLLADPDLSANIDLIVVDNSQNIEPSEAAKATVIPNKNLGGSGGFTRGLLHLKDNGFSHCLFMDDDASCEMEAIRRTFQILQFGAVPNLAVAGSMLREDKPFLLHEKGADYRGTRVINLKNGLDMRKVVDLLKAELPEHVAYGGWWHFAFKISDVKQFSFPFFVRGDDMLFGMTNPFNILTMNGVGGWADDFGLKEGPFTRYLSLRAALVCTMIASDTAAVSMVKTYFKCVLGSALSYNYGGARAYTQAVCDVMKGPQFWVDNIDTSSLRKQIANLAPDEQMKPFSVPADAEIGSLDRTKAHKVFRILTLNGFLLPSFVLKNRTAVEPKNFLASFQRIFRYKQVAFVAPDQTGYVVKHDKVQFFSALFKCIVVAITFMGSVSRLRKQYRTELYTVATEKFWRDIYSKP
ncbi:glycosyltransferase [Brucella grignonensis]|uniref:Glycosyl transferase 2 family protein n=1 Tax=Brucella grignonensis TaxID=94627 RepID=A0A256F271_9HYPH|nr:glycosyltransferase [Brucella grignonensis]OYR08935.1 glycosyl transferase 2 family protein [Brucella grignonensis]